MSEVDCLAKVSFIERELNRERCRCERLFDALRDIARDTSPGDVHERAVRALEEDCQ